MNRRRWGRVAWALLAILVVVALFTGAHRKVSSSISSETLSIAAQVRCPVCEGQSAAQSNSSSSVAIRQTIRTELAHGEDRQQIIAGLVASYGTPILESPPASGVALVVWVLPLLAAVAGTIGLTLAFLRRRRRDGPGRAQARGSDEGGGGARQLDPADAAAVEQAVKAQLEARGMPANSGQQKGVRR